MESLYTRKILAFQSELGEAVATGPVSSQKDSSNHGGEIF